MSKKTSYLLGILLTIVVGSFLYCYLCDDCYCNPPNESEEIKTVVKPEVEPATTNAFAFSDQQGDFSLKVNDNFNFKMSGYSILKPLSQDVISGVMKLKDYLLVNPLKDIDITGYSRADEANPSVFPSLGLARANAVKNYLVSQGIPSKQIDTHGEVNDAINPDETKTFFGPLKFNIVTFEEDQVNEALVALCEVIKEEPITLNFQTGEAQINLSLEQRQKMADISRCVDKLGVMIQIVGHTDNTGDAENNILLGQQRADFAKSYLVRNGIPSGNIQAISKGQTEPIADNSTEQGRTKNRRTVITLK